MASRRSRAYHPRMAMSSDEDRLVWRLGALHDRINKIADIEARSALVGGWAAQGNLMPEKERLIDEAEKILDKLIDDTDA